MSNKKEYKPGYKHTPLGWIPEEWNVAALGDLVEYKKGFAFKTEHYKDTGVRIIRVGDTNADGIKPNGDVYLDPVLKNRFVEFELKSNDIIIQTVGSRPPLYNSMVGKTIIVPEDFAGSLLNQNAVRIRENTGNNYFLFSTLKQKRYLNYIETLIRGNANQVSITLEELFQYQILYPKSNTERNKIAAILSIWDEAITKTQQLIAQLQQRNKGLMQQLLTSKKRLKGFEGEWKKVMLGNLGDSFNGLSGKAKEDFGTGYPYITYMNIFSNHVINKTLLGYVKVSESENQSKVKYGDIFFTVSSETPEEVGMSAVLLSQISDCYLNSFCFGFRLFNFKTFIPEFAAFLLRSENIRKEIIKLAQGSTRFNLSKTGIKKLILKIPNTDEQEAIAKALDAAVSEVRLSEQKLAALQHQKKGLMQKLLTGEVRVKIEN